MQRSKRKAIMKQHNNIEYSKGFTTTSSHSCGFTLIELLVVVAVLGILAGGILIALNITGTLGKASLTKAKKFAASLENGLAISQVGKWSFEETSGTIAKDTSGYGSNGTFTFSVVGGWKASTQCELGFGNCIESSGNDYVSIPDNDNFSFGNSTNDKPFTLSIWVKPVNSSLQEVFISKWASGTGIEWLFVKNSSGVPFLTLIESASGDQASITSNTAVRVGEWNYIVATYNGVGGSSAANGAEIYQNGVKISSPTRTTDVGYVAMQNTPTNVEIARSNFGVAQYFTGLIDEVQIYKEALTLSQIQNIYVSGVITRAMAYK